MKLKRLGASDLQVSEIGFGCMSLGTDEANALAIIDDALQRGVNFFDTADLYDYGRNEELVGKALKGCRSEVIIATKVGNRRIPGKEGWVWDASKQYILNAVHDSLRRLQTDYIDLYQLHGGTMEDSFDDTIEAFEQLRREGVIRHYGISSIRPNVIREYASRSNIVSVMGQYSILDRRPEEEVLPLLEGRGISFIARGPVAKGILSDRGAAKAAQGYLDYDGADLQRLQQLLRGIIGPDTAAEHAALQYVLHQPAVATAIPGASSLEQLAGNAAAAEAAPLTEQQIAAIQLISRANKYEQHR